MSTSVDRGSRWQRLKGSRRTTPALGVLIGVLALTIQAARGDVPDGLVSLAIMVTYAGGLAVFGGRSETVALLRGGGLTDERTGAINQRALAATGSVLVTVLVAGFFVELARGAADVGVWSGLGAVAGVTFLVAMLWFSHRS